jgi:hypothetical protein
MTSRRGMMIVQILYVEGCPHVQPLVDDILELCEGRDDVTVTTRNIAEANENERLVFHGSPTLVIDGRDPFDAPEEPVEASCRLYRGENGLWRGYPSREEIVALLGD